MTGHAKQTCARFQPRRVTDGPIWLRDNNLRRGRSRRIRSMISSSFKRDRTCKATPCAFQPRRVTDGPIWLRDNNLRRGRSRRIRSMISSSFGPRCMSLRTMSLRSFYLGGFAIRISPRRSFWPGLTVNSLRISGPVWPRTNMVESINRYVAPGIKTGSVIRPSASGV